MAKRKIWTPEEVYTSHVPVKTPTLTASQPVVESPASVTDLADEDPAQPMATAVTDSRPSKVVPCAVARLTDPESSHVAADKIPTEKLWERMLTIRNLVLAHPGQCIRWYVNLIAERTPAPELDAPGCRDSAGVPKHDVGFYGVWATLFAQAVKHRLIVKVNNPITPTENLTCRSPYPGENVVHVYEACNQSTVHLMESERKAYFESAEAPRASVREAKVPIVANRQPEKQNAKSVQHEIEAPLGTDPGQSDSWFRML